MNRIGCECRFGAPTKAGYSCRNFILTILFKSIIFVRKSKEPEIFGDCRSELEHQQLLFRLLRRQDNLANKERRIKRGRIIARQRDVCAVLALCEAEEGLLPGRFSNLNGRGKSDSGMFYKLENSRLKDDPV